MYDFKFDASKPTVDEAVGFSLDHLNGKMEAIHEDIDSFECPTCPEGGIKFTDILNIVGKHSESPEELAVLTFQVGQRFSR